MTSGRRRAATLVVAFLAALSAVGTVTPVAAQSAFEPEDEYVAETAVYRLDATLTMSNPKDGSCLRTGSLRLEGEVIEPPSQYPIQPTTADVGPMPFVDDATGRGMSWRCAGHEICWTNRALPHWRPTADGHVTASLHFAYTSAGSTLGVPTGRCLGDVEFTFGAIMLRDAGTAELCRSVPVTAIATMRFCGLVTRADPEPRAATVTGNTGPAPLTVVLNGTVSSSTSPITRYVWDLGDGTTLDGSSGVVVHTYGAPGVFPIRLQVTDAAGLTRWDEVGTAIVQATPSEPVAAISGPDEAEVGEAVTFDARRSSSGSSRTSQIAGFEWDFGDGTQVNTDETTRRWTHTYDSPGRYTVTVRVVTAGGVSSAATHDVVVNGGFSLAPRPLVPFG